MIPAAIVIAALYVPETNAEDIVAMDEQAAAVEVRS
jgi:hypothetical protein